MPEESYNDLQNTIHQQFLAQSLRFE